MEPPQNNSLRFLTDQSCNLLEWLEQIVWNELTGSIGYWKPASPQQVACGTQHKIIGQSVLWKFDVLVLEIGGKHVLAMP